MRFQISFWSLPLIHVFEGLFVTQPQFIIVEKLYDRIPLNIV